MRVTQLQVRFVEIGSNIESFLQTLDSLVGVIVPEFSQGLVEFLQRILGNVAPELFEADNPCPIRQRGLWIEGNIQLIMAKLRVSTSNCCLTH